MEKDSRPQSRILALDTSSAAQAVAVLNEDQVLAESNKLAERNHSVNLLPEIQQLLQQSEINKSDLTGIAVGIGPGSYTGVRIAVTTAKTLAWALKIPVVAVSSLEAQAASGLANTDFEARIWVIPLVDARRGQAYTALFEAEGVQAERLKRLAEDAILLTQDWVAELARKFQNTAISDRPEQILFTGDVAQHAEKIDTFAELSGLSPEKVHAQLCQVDASWIGKIGQHKLAAGETTEAHTLLPNYTQVTEAEANLLKHTKPAQ
ncbi:tRNA (adenosine(37)-N6)-threonylcarbamoyltransferase complex dimerization subunit type 1 TsaB [Saccharibacillus sp. JS10]|uniref:tRNA (adenosine(37)-N6)-threonylcarbamoyltransferase complex dimerization subunit type 1 TsaB n=1 Tax=Saccharibacillus sp. JS10 TaxID=2950552 RepID=UPI0021091FE1|nr:tRNA (adenosine(37)-N6)-threonylcarbamoyltransferase complex dimerization subunit type 1 TsaB [Saccharibacillus sp. JS10]MCQ4086702.1 tRNA (adenosine(37)-N6)-threonylcarbamoyltransferase complex dimerization subunit type 1 TsaB [Saccharibacillus sp. JS10]